MDVDGRSLAPHGSRIDHEVAAAYDGPDVLIVELDKSSRRRIKVIGANWI